MSFLSDTKTAGWALLILGIINLIGALAVLVGAFDGGIVVSEIVVAIGAIIMAVLYFRFGVSVKNGDIPKKIDILAYFVRLAGIGSIVSAIFNFWNNWEVSGGVTAIVSLIIGIIVGLIILAISARINDGKQDTLDKIIWIILVILFILEIIGDVMGIIGIFTASLALDLSILTIVVLPIVNLIIAIFMICLLFDSDVKREMNM